MEKSLENKLNEKNSKKSKVDSSLIMPEVSSKSFWNRFNLELDSLVIDQMTPILETAKMNYWIPEPTMRALEEQKTGQTSIYFVSAFRSIWDAFILPHALTKDKQFNQIWNIYKKQKNPKYLAKDSTGIEMPYVMMNSNLTSLAGFIKSFIETRLKENSKILLVDKNISPMNYRHVLTNIENVLSNNELLLTFPEGTRSRTGIAGDFDSSTFIGAINASKKSNVKIIPINIDYSGVLEMNHLVNGSNYFKMLYSGAMNRRKMKFGRVYLSMGRPIDIHPDMLLPGENSDDLSKLKSLDRKKAELSYRLSDYTKQSCLNLVKIQPINVLAKAILSLDPKPWQTISIYDKHFDRTLTKVINDLSDYGYRFRRFDKLSSTASIVKKSKIEAMISRYSIYGSNEGELLMTPQVLKECKVYANYTSHYVK